MRCDGKTVLVIGAGSGIGRATVQVFSENGAETIVAADINADGVKETVEGVAADAPTCVARTVDITDIEGTKSLIDGVVDEYGQLDALVSTVGWTDISFFAGETPEYWRRVIDLNLFASLTLAHAALPHMSSRKAGSIVLTTSDAGKVGTLGETVYAAAKAGIIGFVKSLARETARDNVRVNAVSPGPTDTPLLRGQMDDMVVGRMVKAVPMKRIGTPREQANVAVFLASDASSFITGQAISVSGGLTMSS
jgi:NAD(P)-dependent dehydrogenase (short-subunit alcohol dehydrogenase family)